MKELKCGSKRKLASLKQWQKSNGIIPNKVNEYYLKNLTVTNVVDKT